ncbi:hypothetical protein ERJ75_000335300 [Trypanosoma vivax]|nr:hypothetical protein ERJ75_000335300 [Trypanosoma vivax]
MPLKLVSVAAARHARRAAWQAGTALRAPEDARASRAWASNLLSERFGGRCAWSEGCRQPHCTVVRPWAAWRGSAARVEEGWRKRVAIVQSRG